MRRILGLIGAGALAIGAAGALGMSTANAAITNYSATLTGAEEVPANGSTYNGTAMFTIDDVGNQVCATWTINNPGTDPVTAAHIHTGIAGTSNPPLINTGIVSGACVAAQPADIAAIMANPAGFYFNVHTTNFPGGGARGQLAATAVTTTTTAQSTTTSTPTATTTAPACSANYVGECIPSGLTAALVNCSPTAVPAGGYQVTHRVRVVGADPYGLDSNNDGFGCDALPNGVGVGTVSATPSFAG